MKRRRGSSLFLAPNARGPLLVFTRRAILSTACLGLITWVAHAQDGKLDVGVRPKIIDRSNLHTDKTAANPGSGGHGKLYSILSVAEVKSEEELVMPVDESMILQVLSAELNKNGFKPSAPGQKPEILITASYGRAELQNPYIRDGGETAGDNRAGGFLGVAAGTTTSGASATGAISGGVSNDSGASTTVITGAFSQQLIDEKTNGYQAKLQKASYEKLFIRVTAWSFPGNPRAQAKMLWKTIMVVDDPDHRDLNAVAAKMLEAGAPFFDREIKDPEVDIYKPLPEGHVNVGTPAVVEGRTKSN